VLFVIYYYDDQGEVDEMDSGIGKKRNAYKIFVGNPEGNRLLGRHGHKCAVGRIMS
jgi:hypothetical protein